MSSSYSSLDWVLSHWAHFTARIIVSTVGWTWWDWSQFLRTYLPSVLWHCMLGCWHGCASGSRCVWPRWCHPLSSDRQHLSYDVCLEVRGEIIRTVLFCIVYW